MNGQTDKQDDLTGRVRAALLLQRRPDGDRLMLDDATLGAALDGSRPLTGAERAALQASPLTARRLRHLALARRAQASGTAGGHGWRASTGMLRAAASGVPAAVVTDDGWWTLHFARAADGWRAILQLAPHAPFAASLLAARPPLRVLDGAGAVILAGALDADGEVEAAWPFAAAPGAHLQAQGAAFRVQLDG